MGVDGCDRRKSMIPSSINRRTGCRCSRRSIMGMVPPPNGVAFKLRALGLWAQGTQGFAPYDNCRRPTATVPYLLALASFKRLLDSGCNSALAPSGLVRFRRTRSIGNLVIQRFPVRNATAEENGPFRNGWKRILCLRQEPP